MLIMMLCMICVLIEVCERSADDDIMMMMMVVVMIMMTDDRIVFSVLVRFWGALPQLRLRFV